MSEADKQPEFDGKFAPGHKCPEKSLQVMVIYDGETEEEEGEQVTAMDEQVQLEMVEVSANYLVSLLGLRVDATRETGVRLGNGKFDRSSGLCRSVVLRLPGIRVVEDFYPLELGSTDVILGIKWQRTLGDIRVNWKTLTMSFEGPYSRVVLKGEPGLTRAETLLRALVRDMEGVSEGFLVELTVMEIGSQQDRSWKRQYGYDRVNDDNDLPIIEAKMTDDQGKDPFTKRRSEKKQRVERQEKHRLHNLKEAEKVCALPSHVQLAATALPITGQTAPRKRVERQEKHRLHNLKEAEKFSALPSHVQLAATALPITGQTAPRKFLPAVKGSVMGSLDKQQTDKILNKLMAKNSHKIFNVSKAVDMYNVKSYKKRRNQQSKSHQP
ncbi:Ribosomal biogenesis regulatory protein [Artemisia annua]|uniref:Ribosome biogenesis regulatory protein n=1 Tax=Artemisia annua TaxID=35608 RepID=A0A2U1QA51_ARTAN|nr:Ribosomal biogenesis regulatory protein [Artemisia annua]